MLTWEVREDDGGSTVAVTWEKNDAALIADLHNTWLPLCNAWYLGRRALKDRENVLELQEKEQ
jgi:hypothetical protein